MRRLRTLNGSIDSEPRSISLRGVEIGRVIGEMVQDIAVSCDFGGLKAEIFMQNGLARMWTLFCKVSLPGGQEERWIVGKVGIVRNKGDAKGYEKSKSASSMALGSLEAKGGRQEQRVRPSGRKRLIRWLGSGLPFPSLHLSLATTFLRPLRFSSP